MNPTAEDMTYMQAQEQHRLLSPRCESPLNDVGDTPLDRTYSVHAYLCPKCRFATGKVRRLSQRSRVRRAA